MKLTVLNSGSSANGYVLQNENEAVVIECGCPVLACEKVLHFNVKKVVAVLCTHEHQDHARYLEQYSEYMPVYATRGTLAELGLEGKHNCNSIPTMELFTRGKFRILAFPTQHDAKEPCGFLISHPDFGNLMFATDTYYLRYKFPKLTYAMIECNYDADILKKNVEDLIVPKSVRDRVIKSHMSLKTCITALKANDLRGLRGVVLLHLSSNNSDKEAFVSRVQQATGKYVVAAEKDLEINLL